MDIPRITVLLIEDNPGDIRLIRELLREAAPTPFQVIATERLASGLELLAGGGIDVVLLDLSLAETQGLETFQRVYSRARDVPIVVLTAWADLTVAVAALQEGAQDYLVKGQVVSDLLVRSLRFAIERHARHRVEAILQSNQSQFRLARQIQKRLCPAAAPVLAGFDLCGGWYPADATSGDYYDYIPMGGGRLGIVVADVCGHGLGPALLMAETRAYLRALAQTLGDLGAILTLTNRLLAEDIDDDRFVTLFFAELDPRARTLRHVGAGHRSYLLPPRGQAEVILDSTTPPLGLDADPIVPLADPVLLEPGDVVVFLTDGIVEAISPADEPFGIHRALDVVRATRHRPACQIVEALYHAVRSFTGTVRQRDDITTVILKVEPEP
ncbi:MAG TPA: fused response regulator/phosphatase [Isosphaeraceae bacterium]|jgi:serine phosphatase RsbU (regulator of sigma subunit)